MIQRYEINIQGDPPTLGDPALIPNDNGNLLLYADAEKWVQAEIDERDRTTSRLNNDLCDRRISLEAALKLCKEKDAEIAALKADNENMAKLNDSFPEEIARLEDEIAALKEKINQTVIAKP